MAEILAPCGSPQALEAALRTGCDAVYLGGELFSARQNAANFSDEELEKAVRACHISGVKVYQAINTVITDKELELCAEAVRKACELGVDGLITQDLALVAIVREMCPGMEIHASTQMSLHTENGALLAKELGFSRAVAARELPESILSELCALPLEIEVFVHGALCMSVSGQCYMSAVIGSRSANRGLCAQACRLPASCEKGGPEKHALSLKDMSYIGSLKKLEDMGAASLKIEGRMKRPEYVAAAVSAARADLSGEKPDLRLLEGVFSRSGFTDSYLKGQPGRQMFGFRRKEDVEAAAGVLPELHELYRHEYKRAKVGIRALVVSGEPCSVSMTDENGLSAEVSGDPPVKALNRAADEEYLKKQLSKLGDTVYEAGEFICRISEGVTVPASQLNDMRRRVCAELDRKRYEHYTRKPEFVKKRFSFAPPERNGRRALRLYVRSAGQLSLLEEKDAELIYADPALCEELLAGGFEKERLCCVMPRFTFDEKRDIKRLGALIAAGLEQIECTNPAHIRIGRDLGLTMHGGFGLNAANSAALRELKALGLRDCVVSFELRAQEISALAGELPIGVTGYGRLPMMLTVNCPIKAERGCARCTGRLFDRTGRAFPVRCSREQGYTELLNADILCISDMLAEFSSADYIKLDFFDESPERVRDTVKAFVNREKLPGEGLTKGLYRRGVK